jgi:hypothetical protein
MDTYKCLWIFNIKVIFLVVLKCNKIQNVSYPVKILISSQKFREISRNFVIFRNTKFREISQNKKSYFA